MAASATDIGNQTSSGFRGMHRLLMYAITLTLQCLERSSLIYVCKRKMLMETSDFSVTFNSLYRFHEVCFTLFLNLDFAKSLIQEYKLQLKNFYFFLHNPGAFSPSLLQSVD